MEQVFRNLQGPRSRGRVPRGRMRVSRPRSSATSHGRLGCRRSGATHTRASRRRAKLLTAFARAAIWPPISIRSAWREAAGAGPGTRFHGCATADLDTEFSTRFDCRSRSKLKLSDLIARLQGRTPTRSARSSCTSAITSSATGSTAASSSAGQRGLSADEGRHQPTSADSPPRVSSTTCTPSTSARSASRWKAATA